MENRPSYVLKNVAAELSALIYENSNDKERMKALLAQLNYFSEEKTEVKGKELKHSSDEDNNIGIWRLVHMNGKSYYERDIRKQLKWPLWAQVHQIKLKGVKKRIVLLGESVARGYFYDPYYTVANELEGILQHVKSAGDVEVIDLARTSTHMEEVLDTAMTSLKLEPDAVVVFAGNNWIGSLSYVLFREDYKIMYGLLQQGLLYEMENFLERKFSSLISGFTQRLQALFKTKQIPVVIVIPPFNLKDWKSDDTEKILPWLPDNRVAKWIDARKLAYNALKNKQYEEFENAAQKMVESDPSNPLGYELLAEAHMINKKWEEAIQCLEQGRDTGLISRGNNSKPRCLRIIADTLQADAATLGMSLVNLPEIFNYLPGIPVPDCRLFLDYCHLTIKGIKIAMKHTAMAVCSALYKLELPVEAIPESGIQPPDEVKAIAHFCAAIHNAHYGQSANILAYHCRLALAFSQEIKKTMLNYIDFSSRNAPTVVCRSFEETIMESVMRQYEGGLALLHPKEGKLMDIVLIDVIVQELLATGTDVRHLVSEIRKKEHGINTEKINLLESFYSRTTYNDFLRQPAPSFYQERSTDSAFQFVTNGDQDIAFEIVLRTPGREYQGKMIKLFVNGLEEHVAEFPMSYKWEKYFFTIRKQALEDGVNRLMIEWPYTLEPLAITSEIDKNTFLTAAFPVLGEIYAFAANAKISDYNVW